MNPTPVASIPVGVRRPEEYLVCLPPEALYPDDDGKPISDNTLQFQWIATLQGNLAALFRGAPDVFVAGNNLIYAVEDDPKMRRAPDVYVAFGRPKGHRGSYQVWNEGGVFPQVVFEVLSPGNRPVEMARTLLFYEEYGAEEYYLIDPMTDRVEGYVRGPDALFNTVEDWAIFVSPRLGIRFDLTGPALVIRDPAGRPFRTFEELAAVADDATARADREAADNARLRDLLKAAGVDPEETS